MDSQEYIENYPTIAVSTARTIINEHESPDISWLKFAFTDHPEAITFPAGEAVVNTETLLNWLGY